MWLRKLGVVADEGRDDADADSALSARPLERAAAKLVVQFDVDILERNAAVAAPDTLGACSPGQKRALLPSSTPDQGRRKDLAGGIGRNSTDSRER